MKISKGSVLQAFKILNNAYVEFYKRIEDEKKLQGMIDTWKNILDTVNLDYKEANSDFILAVETLSAKNKYIPTIAEIIETIKQIKSNREYKKEQFVEIDTSQLTQEEYSKLVRKEITVQQLIEKGRINVG